MRIFRIAVVLCIQMNEKRKAGGLGVRVSALIRKNGVLMQRRANLGEGWLTVRQIKR